MAPARILIVEDDRVVARDIAQQLVRYGHIVAGQLASGEQAIALASQTPLDLVLMDVRLEGELDGIDTARQLRETHNLPVVFLTAYADEETVRRATVTEPFGYVLKPFDDQQLRTVVEMALYKHAAERRLRESEQRYAVTLASIGDGVIATDCDSCITLINPVAEAMTGWTRDEALGQPLAKVLVLIDEDTDTPLNDVGTAVLRERAEVELPPRTRLLGRHGREVPVENRRSPIVDDTGQVVGVVLAIRDATETRRAAQAKRLRETNERLGAAMRGSNVGVWELETTGDDERDWAFRCWNVREWLGYDEHADVVNLQRFTEMVHPDDRGRFGETFGRQCRKPAGAIEIEHRLLHRDGSCRWVLTRGTPCGSSGGGPLRLSGTLVDITELKRVEQALRASEERFRGTFENAAVGIAHCASDGRFLRVNERCCEIVGYTRNQLFGMTFTDVIEESSRSASASRFGLLFEKKISHYTEDKLFVRGDGTQVWVNVSVAMQCESSEQTYHAIAILQDISGRKALEATVRIARDEAEAANKAKDQFLANISHELRTPLNGILGYAQMLRGDDGLGARQRSHVAVIEQSGTHLLTLINDLLEFARIGADRIELQPGDVLLAPFLEMLAEIVGVRAREKGLTQTCLIAPCLPIAIRVDEKRLRQVLLNLLSNAVKFTDEGEVAFAVRQVSEGILRFEVRDTGVGIRPDHVGRVFEPFEQAGDSERRSAGVGLGLPISQHLVRLMGSEIHVESEHGRGSRFWFDLAIPGLSGEARDADDGNGTRQQGSDGPAAGAWPQTGGHGPEGAPEAEHGGPPLVLVVDDTASNLGLVVDFLEGKGLRVSIAREGEEALRRAEFVNPDLILLDVMMPGLDGFDACRRLKGNPRTREIPVIFMTSLSQTEDKTAGFHVGAVDYVTKPLQMEELFARVMTHLKLGRLQKALKERNARLQDEVRSRETAQEALIEMINSVRNTSNAIAHDLRTPLTEFRSRMEVMIIDLKKKVDVETLERLEAALADIDRVIGIFNALLRLAEIDAGVRNSGFIDSDVAHIVSEAVEFYQPLAELRVLTLSLSCPDSLPARVDPLLLAQAIGNIIDNALKFARTQVHVSVRALDGSIEAVVSDDGPGVPEPEKAKVTERFYRGDASRGTPGVGLGLALVKGVATLHRGELRFGDNNPGLIATLTLSC